VATAASICWREMIGAQSAVAQAMGGKERVVPGTPARSF
jgi:hypothetical protein